MINTLSIKQKISSLIILVVVATAALIGAFSQHTAKSIIEQRVINTELPSIIKQINLTIDKQISVMLTLAKEIASDEHVLAWNANKTAQGEALLIKKLARIANQNNLTNASFANQQSANYWNQEGFLRQLKNDNVDGWFFSYTASPNNTMSSLYVYPDSNNVDLFVNYKQSSGIGLSGISRSFNDVAAMLDGFKLEKSGFVFLTDKQGKIQLHRERDLVNSATLSSLYGQSVAQNLLHSTDFNLSTLNIDGQRYIIASSYIPSMDWYVVAQVPYSEMFALLDQASLKIIVAVTIISLFAMLLAYFIGSSVSRPIETLSQLFTKLGQGEADLNYRIPELGQKELVEVAKGYNQFVTKLDSAFVSVMNNSNALNNVANSLRDEMIACTDTARGNEVINQEVGVAIEQINQALVQVSQHAQSALDSAQDIASNDTKTNQQLAITQQQLATLSSKISDVSHVITNLTSRTDAIVGALEVIKSISDQTNLLALNAAIEAARAGEHGRGFAVVADEVRTLASKTVQSTDEIAQIMKDLRDNSDSAIAEMQQIIEQSQITNTSFETTQQQLANNHQILNALSSVNEQVASATEQQSAGIAQISVNMQHMQQSTSEQNASLAQVSADASSIGDYAKCLASSMAQFNKS